MPHRFDRIAASKPFVFALCLLPLAWLVWDTLHNQLGTDPVAQLEHRSGDWTLRILLATLGVTPLRLHRLVYLIGICGVLHFMWQVKSGNKIAVREPLIYLTILIGLLALRVPGWLKRWHTSRHSSPARAAVNAKAA